MQRSHFGCLLNSTVLNTDRSSKGNPGPAGCGGVLRDDVGRWIMGYCSKLGQSTNLEAELWGILRGLEMLSQNGMDNIEVETDSEVAVNLIRNGTNPHFPYKNLVENCNELLKTCNSTFGHTLREGSKVADAMANLGVNHEDPITIEGVAAVVEI